MIVLDAYAVLAFLMDEAAAEQVEELVRAGDAQLTTVGVAEVVDRLVRLAGADEDTAALDLAALSLLDGLPVDAALGLAAGRLRSRRYHRTRCAVSMADCIAAEAARTHAATLATSDPHLLDLCRAEAIEYTVLPATDGSFWAPT